MARKASFGSVKLLPSLAFLLAAVFSLPLAAAEPEAAASAFFDGASQSIRHSCDQIKAGAGVVDGMVIAPEERESLTAHYCACLPAEMKRLRDGAALAERMTSAAFERRYHEKAVYKCVAEKARRDLEMEACADDSVECSCLKRVSRSLSDEDVVAVGAAAAEWIPAAAEARERGTALEMPPVLKAYADKAARCVAGR